MVVEIDGVALHLAHPDELSVTWVEQEEVMRNCWPPGWWWMYMTFR